MPNEKKSRFSAFEKGLTDWSRGVSTYFGLPDKAKTKDFTGPETDVWAGFIDGSIHEVSQNLKDWIDASGKVKLNEGVIAEIRFDEGDYYLDTDAKSIIKKIYIESKQNWSLILEGYANYRGPKAFNITLSNNRALAVLGFFKELISKLYIKRRITIDNITTFPHGERDEPPHDDFFEVQVKKDRCVKIILKFIPVKLEPWTEGEVDAEADEYIRELKEKLDYWKDKKDAPKWIKIAAKNYAEDFLKGRKEDFLRVLKDIFMKNEEIYEFALRLSKDFGGTLDSKILLVKRDIGKMRPLKYYLFLRDIVYQYVKPFEAGSASAYKKYVPKSFQHIWKDCDQFLAGFKTGLKY